ncbi:MAG TPA: NUMOD3 domain-containing DNA-binding protein [Rhizobium sp.]
MADNKLPLFEGAGKFYVYVYRDPRPKKKMVPIYVGKGTAAHGRADVHWKKGARNPLFKAVLDKVKALDLVPIIEIVAWFDDEAEAFQYEQRLIEKFGIRSAGGTLCNLVVVDTGGGWTHSEETKKKLSIAGKGKKRGPPSPETCAKISEAQKGKKRGPNPAHSARMTGRRHAPEHCAAISAGNMGRKFSPETIEKIVAAHKGQTRSPKARNAMRDSHLGKSLPNDVKSKIGASNKIAWAENPGRLKQRESMCTDEYRERMRQARANRKPLSDETRAKLRAAANKRWAVEKRIE